MGAGQGSVRRPLNKSGTAKCLQEPTAGGNDNRKSHQALPIPLRTVFSVPLDRNPCQGHERRGTVELHFIFQSLISRKMMAELLLKILRKGSSVTKLEIQKRGEKLRGSRGCHSETILSFPHTGRDLSHRLQH